MKYTIPFLTIISSEEYRTRSKENLKNLIELAPESMTARAAKVFLQKMAKDGTAQA